MLSTHINAPSLNNQHSKIQEIEECKKRKKKKKEEEKNKKPKDIPLSSSFLRCRNHVDDSGTLGIKLSNCSGDTTVVKVAVLLTVRGP